MVIALKSQNKNVTQWDYFFKDTGESRWKVTIVEI
jgi:hypothetical protein